MDNFECVGCGVILVRGHVERGLCFECWPKLSGLSGRMVELRLRLLKAIRSRARFEQLSGELEVVSVECERDQVCFDSYRDDLVGDLFNGCFGSEWLLDVSDGENI